MANHASSKKRIRQTRKRTERNRHVRTTTRTYVKRVRAALAEGNPSEARKWFDLASQRIDAAVSKGVYHWKTGARYVSRLAQQVAALETKA